MVDLSGSDIPPREAAPPPAAVDYARKFVRRGLPLDSLLRAYHIGQATFFRRWCEKAHADLSRQAELVEAIELGASWAFDYVDTLSQGLVRRYGEERERWVGSVAAVSAQVVDSLLAAEPIQLDARGFVARELGQLAESDEHSRRLSATLRVYLEENMSPLPASQPLGVHESPITNRIRAAQELLPHHDRAPLARVARRAPAVQTHAPRVAD